MPNCPVCGHKLTPYNTDPDTRVEFKDIGSLPVCRECAEKRKQRKIGGIAGSSNFYFKSAKTDQGGGVKK